MPDGVGGEEVVHPGSWGEREVLFERVSKAADVVAVAIIQLCNVAFVIMTVLIALLVFTRNFMGFSFAWTEELTRAMMVWIALLGASVLSLKNDHIGLESPARKIGPRFALVVEIICRVLILGFLALLLQQAWFVTQSRGVTRLPVLGVSMFWVYLAIPVGSVLLILANLIRLWDEVLQLMGKRPIPKHEDNVLQHSGV